MKIFRCLWHSTLGVLLFAPCAWADPTPDQEAEAAYHAKFDADGVPLAVTQGRRAQEVQEEIDALHKQQEEAAANKDWLLKAFEEQQKKHRDSDPNNQSSNLYYQLSTNKELAKLAGLPWIESDPHNGATFHAGDPKDKSNGVALRQDPNASGAGSSPTVDLSQPLISPLGSAGMNSVTAPLAMSIGSSDVHFLPPTAPETAKVEQTQDATDLDTPGMIAAKKDPLTDSTTLDSANSDLLVLPGETTAQAEAHQDNNLELSLPMDATQLHAQQTRALTPTGLPQPVSVARTTATATTTNPNATPIPDPNDEKSVPPPVINPVRAANPSPFDILNR